MLACNPKCSGASLFGGRKTSRRQSRSQESQAGLKQYLERSSLLLMKGRTGHRFVSMMKTMSWERRHTLEKNPHTFDKNNMKLEMTKNGRFPQILAPDAVKKVVNPIQKARKPIIKLETMSRLTLYFFAMIWIPGVTMGPMLSSLVHLNDHCVQESLTLS